MTQKQQISQHLQSGKSLTPLESLNLHQCFRLASRIDELRKDGLNIITTMVKTESGKHIASYKLERIEL